MEVQDALRAPPSLEYNEDGEDELFSLLLWGFWLSVRLRRACESGILGTAGDIAAAADRGLLVTGRSGNL